MLETILPEEMKNLEAQWMAANGVPSCLLMAEAAQGVDLAIAERLPRGGKVLFLCGPGNNGGDGCAAAWLWRKRGQEAMVWETRANTAGDPGIFRRLALTAGVPVTTLKETPAVLPDCDLVCDALFGTGLSRAPEGVAAGLIRLVNGSSVPVVAVDIPSGLNGADGTVPGEAVIADETVTFHRPKAGLYLRKGCRHAGRVRVHPILIPPDCGGVPGLRVLEQKDHRKLIPPRPADAHKGSLGRVVIFAGSVGMAGAAALCASACVHAGAGLTRVLCRPWVAQTVQALVPEATCTLLPEADGRLLPEAAEIARKALADADAAAVGPGLSQGADVLPVLKAFAEAECPTVFDADALNLMAVNGDLRPRQDAVLTPHPGEAARLLGLKISDVTADPLAALKTLQTRFGCRVLLKGARTLMAAGEAAAVNPNGTPALAKGGSGDVLTGLLAALLARPGLPGDALLPLQLAAFLHADAAARAGGRFGENGVTGRRLVDAIRV